MITQNETIVGAQNVARANFFISQIPSHPENPPRLIQNLAIGFSKAIFGRKKRLTIVINYDHGL